MKKFAFITLLATLLIFGLVICNTTNDETNSMPDTSSINGSEGGENPLEKIEGHLTDFYQKQINADLNETVTFKLYTNESGDEFNILEVSNETALNESNFDTKRHTYFITHGYRSSSDSLSCTLVRYALQNSTDSNIIIVNWSPLSNSSYAKAILSVSRVGEYIGEFINILYENGMKSEATTLIGHSLGAHVMGFSGQNVNEKVNHTIGLDPAGPLFVGVPANDRLSPDDAIHVEIIHTNAGMGGSPFNLGHYDFYPNGGILQPGCHGTKISSCSHGRSYYYLAEQISNPGPDFYSLNCTSYLGFIEKKCTNEIAFMGGISSYPANQGTYYLKTNNAAPFSLTTP